MTWPSEACGLCCLLVSVALLAPLILAAPFLSYDVLLLRVRDLWFSKQNPTIMNSCGLWSPYGLGQKLSLYQGLVA